MKEPSPRPTSVSEFFSQLVPIKNWVDMGAESAYVEMPDDWWIFLTDIKGSTKAIENGRYKDVNIIGACSILSVQNSLKSSHFPFIFGGDGVTFFLPAADREKALKALAYTRNIAKDNFGFDLRIFCAPINQIKASGKNIFVSYVLSSQTKPYFLFHGGGITKAEELMKKNPEFSLPADSPAEGSHDGLECRWNPIANKRGLILVLIIKPLDDSQAIESILFRLEELLPVCQPVQPEKMPIQWPPKDLLNEMKAKNLNVFNFLKALLWTGFVFLVMKATLKNKNGVAYKYLEDVAKNNDFFKRDDNLRLVLDVSLEERDRIYAILNDFKKAGVITFGYHETDKALMTCVAKGQDEHFHFIDGADGGYAKAATMLKKE